jgi:acyl-lipid omega-6 desaturase (Delta-12 desaturase)
MATHPPAARDLHHLCASDRAGAAVLGSAVGVCALGLGLGAQSSPLLWLIGQLLLALAYLQWLAILHESGHETLFRTRPANRIAGRLAGLFALIPFACWTRVHARHHYWTGWQDLDPTATSLTPRRRGRFERGIVNVCWRLWIPLFAVVYRLANYWHLPRLWMLFPSRHDRRSLLASVAGLALVYAAILVAVGPWQLARLSGLGLFLAFVAQDGLLLSQHTHIPQHLSHGEPVRPFRALAQEAFTRSLRLPGWLSRMLLHLDAHELHHMYPFVPGYRLREIAYQPDHEIHWWRWLRSARRLRGEVFLFQNRRLTGWDL